MTTRLPNVGGDDGDWGDILNAFLEVSHNTDGSLNASAVSAAGAELVSHKGVAGGYASLDGSGNVLSSQLGNVPTATTSSSGLVQLSGDLGGTATSPTVPGAEKTSHKDQPNGYAGLDGSGLLKVAELPYSVANANWFTVVNPLGIFTFQQGSWSMQNGGGTSAVCNSSSPFSGGGSVGDALSTTVILSAGTYDIIVVHWNMTGGGQVNVLLDSSIIGNIDIYDGSDSPNNFSILSGNIVSTSGVHTIKFVVTGQNAGSNGFVAPLQSVQFVKTA